METETARICVRSRRQAMDWSLVLVSQGIESVPEHQQENGQWALVVDSAQYEQALAAIRQYRVENRGWRWRRQELGPGIIFDWSCLAWALLLTFFFLLEETPGLRDRGHMASAGVAMGEWWRLLTAVWLHGDLGHLAVNAVLGTVLLGLTMGRYGTGIGLLGAYLAGAGGNVIAWWLAAATHRSLGASGMVMGCLGLLAVQSLRTLPRGSYSLKWLLTGIAGALMLFVLLGLSPGSDVLAHFGGFVSGLALGAFLAAFRDLPERRLANLLAGTAFALLTILPWWLALTRTI